MRTSSRVRALVERGSATRPAWFGCSTGSGLIHPIRLYNHPSIIKYYLIQLDRQAQSRRHSSLLPFGFSNRTQRETSAKRESIKPVEWDLSATEVTMRRKAAGKQKEN